MQMCYNVHILIILDSV